MSEPKFDQNDLDDKSMFDFLEEGAKGKPRQIKPEGAERDRVLPIIRKPVPVSESGPLLPPKPGDPVEPPPRLTSNTETANLDLNFLDGLDDKKLGWAESDDSKEQVTRINSDSPLGGAEEDIRPTVAIGRNSHSSAPESEAFQSDPTRKVSQSLEVDDFLSGLDFDDDKGVLRRESNRPGGFVPEPETPASRKGLWSTLGLMLVAGGAAAYLYVQQPTWLQSITGTTATGSSEEGSSVVSANDEAPVKLTLKERFNQKLAVLESLVADGELDEADKVLESIDYGVYGYGRDEFTALKSQIAELRLGGATEASDAERLAEIQATGEEVARVAAEKAAREEATQVAAEKAAREEAARVAAEKAAREEAARVAAEKAAREEAARVAAEKAAREEAARVAAEKTAREEAAQVAAEKAAREEAARVAAEKAAREEAAQVAAEKAAREEAEKAAAASAVPSVIKPQVDEDRLATDRQIAEERAALERQRAREQRLIDDARSREVAAAAQRKAEVDSSVREITPVAPTPVPAAPPVARTTIGDDELQQVYRQFVELQRAISSRDINKVIGLTERSGIRVQQFMQLFENSSEIDARIKNVSTRNATGEIHGVLQINKIRRADGTFVKPSAALSTIALSSKRDVNGWSAIYW